MTPWAAEGWSSRAITVMSVHCAAAAPKRVVSAAAITSGVVVLPPAT